MPSFNARIRMDDTRTYDLLVFIGRFQPLHLGHQEVIERALSMSKQVLVLAGSANAARSVRNPLTYDERREIITNIYPTVLVRPLNDHTYNDTAWISEVQSHVKQVLLPQGKWTAAGLKDYKIGLIGCEKDHTSYYLKMFPDWGNESIKFINPLNATAFRKMLYEGNFERHIIASEMHIKTVDWLLDFTKTPEFAKLKAEYEYVEAYKKQWGEGPFLTADALVQVGGKILLITRGKEYGHGLLALPGGFVNKNERFQEAAIRELREETNTRVPVPVLVGSIRNRRVFDDPHRSERGRLVTECFHIHLTNDTKLPEVRGGDDADKADFYDVQFILDNPQLFFEDHHHMIKIMLGLN